MVPLKPGNAGGGKGPRFWVCVKEARSGDWREPTHTVFGRTFPSVLYGGVKEFPCASS
jgi:hypothetical protein